MRVVGNDRRGAGVVLLALLLVLALRMTMTESVHQALSLMTAVSGKGATGVAVADIGPGVTAGLGVVTIFLAGVAAWIGGRCGVLRGGRVGRLVVILLVAGLGWMSVMGAANKFVAVVGLVDVGMGLLGGWAVSVLCQGAVLGDRGRRVVAAALVAILAAWTGRGLYQRFVDIPDTIAYFQQHKEEAIAQALGPTQHFKEGDPQLKLLESRMMSKEVSGYVTLSNVMGAGLVGLVAALAGVLVESVVERKKNAGGTDDGEHGRDARATGEISLPVLLWGLGVLLVAAGLVTVVLTASRGGSVMAVVSIVGIVAGAYGWRWVVAHRGAVLAMVVAAVVLGAAAVVGYGLARDRLPSKSLMFRWHYWTAAAKLVEAHPALGVGLNNFGDYYTSVKRSSAPEDVKDPHSFFVRVAAEMGVPAMVLVGVLIVWMAWGATRVRAVGGEEEGRASAMWGTGVMFCVVWWGLHQVIAEVFDNYYVILTVLAGGLAIGGWLLASTLLSMIGRRGVRMVCVAMLSGAMGMMVYDQINMALVTGPVAMLFWVMLGVADSYDEPVTGEGTVKGCAGGMAIGAMLVAVGVVAAVALWWPITAGHMAWDASPWMAKYLQVVQPGEDGRVDFAAAEAALTKALARAPRSSELRRQLVMVKLQRREPVAEEIRKLVELDHANARPRMTLALPETDLPADERVKMLEEALRFDAALPVDEVMRLSAEERAGIEAKIEELKGRDGGGAGMGKTR